MSMEPLLLLLVLYSEAELRRGGETSDGAAASNHLATVTDLLDHQLGSETSGLAVLLVRACGAETFVPWTLLERAGASCVFMLELNFHSGSSIYSSQWFACLASHTSRSDSPVAHPIAGELAE
ncbi:hypothetical protein DY000_02030169 [Brassica cretica]|uniref:Secreted protein n=1 Tax=Brassica cretica TaxID=69181 RepID=A0ABQ7DJE3_BRACR|nr:hypothetical protein DY000_02030169 [Brassica cretica]